MITRECLTAMKNGVYLINTAHGQLLDDDAVIEFLDNGKLAGVAIDAFRNEPPGLGSIGEFTSESSRSHIFALLPKKV